MDSDEEPTFELPQQRELDFHRHEYICPACIHEEHGVCDDGCRFCGSMCTCECSRWRITRTRRR